MVKEPTKLKPQPLWSRSKSVRLTADLATLQDLAARVEEVIRNARQNALKPGNEKTLRSFTLTQTIKILGIHTKAFYELLKNPDPTIPKGEMAGKKRLFTLADIHRLMEYLGILPHQLLDIQRPVVITVANFKGGVTKTTTAAHIAQRLARDGFRVNVIDMDAQGSLSWILGVNPVEVGPSDTMLQFMYGPPAQRPKQNGRALTSDDDSEDVAPWTGVLHTRPTYWHGLHITPSNTMMHLSDLVLDARRQTNPGFAFYRPVADAIATLGNRYDVYIIDTPPSLSLSLLAALYAADGLIIPSPAEALDFESLKSFFEMVAESMDVIDQRLDEPKVFDFLKVLVARYEPQNDSQKRLANWLQSIFDKYLLREPMLSTRVVGKVSTNLQTLYEVQKYKGSREAFKRAIEAADVVADEIEADIVDTLKSRQQRGRTENVAASVIADAVAST